MTVLNVEKLKMTISEKGINITRMAGTIGISQSGFYRILQSGDCMLSTFVSIVNYLDVFPGDYVESVKNKYMIQQDATNSRILQDLLAAQRKIIELQDIVQNYSKIEGERRGII